MDGAARPAARLLVLTGPSGVAIASVVESVRARSPEVWLPVPLTTRPRREPERDGVSRWFVDRAEFARRVVAGDLLEWTELAGHRYGTPRGPVESRLRAGRPVLLRLDPAGARQVRRVVPRALLVWLAPPERPERVGGAPATDPDAVMARDESDVTVVVDSVGRAADELVGLLGSPVLL